MAYVTPENRGSLFKNDSKDRDTSPEHSGEINVGGVLYFIDAWDNEYGKGTYLSLRVKRKDKQTQSAPVEEPEEVIPF